MPDNTDLNSASGGDKVVTREVSHGGDTSKLPGSFIVGMSGTEGSYTYAVVDGSVANGLEVDVTRVQGTVTIDNGGTFVVQVDGDALTSLQLIDDAIAAEGSALGKGILLQGDDGTDRTNVLVDAAGHLQVDAVSNALPTGAATETTLDEIKTAVEAIDDWDEANRAAVNLIASQTAVAGGTGVDAANVLRVTLATDIALPTGTNAIGKLSANSGVDIGDVDVTSISAGSNLIGDIGIQGRTTGGLSIFRSIDLDETEEEVKGSAGTIYSMIVMNLKASTLYLKIYDNTAAGTTVGTTTPTITIPIPTLATTNGAGFVWTVPQGLACSTGITVACTTALADNDTGAPGANECVINMGYK